MKVVKFILFWLLSLTWGIIMTAIGLITAAAFIITFHKPKLFGCFVYFETGSDWGGFNLGPFFICSKNTSIVTKKHEAGHGIQNIIYGPLMPFIVSIPSAIRYHYRKYLIKSGKKKFNDLPLYDAIWFEKQATDLGNKLLKNYL